MATILGTETLDLTKEERTWRINIDSPKGEDPVVTAWREIVRTAPDGTVISREQAGSIQRALSTVAENTIPVPGGNGMQLSIEQLAATIAATADQWRQQDIEAEAARLAAAEAARLAAQNEQED